MKLANILLCMVLALFAGNLTLAAQDTAYTFGDDFAVEPCPPEAAGALVEITCGSLSVPENRSNPGSRTIEVAVAIAHSPNAQSLTPLAVLGGGPGNELISLIYASPELAAALAAQRDVIFIEQRGVGYSRPRLDCPNESAMLRQDIDAVRECYEILTAAGTDLTGYNSIEAAADVAVLRIALGIDEWNIFGGSYGTRWALTVARNFPDGVSSLVLDGVFPPQMDFEVWMRAIPGVIDRLIATCAADADCGAAYPDLATTLRQTITSLNESPLIVWGVPFNGDRLTDLIVNFLYDASLIPLVPALIDAASKGNTAFIEAQVPSGALQPDANASDQPLKSGIAAYLSVQCNEEIAFTDRAAFMQQVEDADPLVASIARTNLFEFVGCDEWQSGQAPAIENTPVTSSIPTLILNGEFDAATPLADGYLAAETLENATVLDFPGVGHTVIYTGECPLLLIETFLNTLDGAGLDTSCIAADYGVPDFVLPAAENAAQSPDLASFLQQYADSTFSEGSAPAIAVQVTVGDNNIRAAVGSRDGAAAAQPNDRFRIGSMSKTFVAATALLMAQDGLINLDAPAADYLPADMVNQIANLGGSGGATVRQLLAMQSGIPDYLQVSAFQEQVRAIPDYAWTAADAVAYAFGLPALFAPGENVNYSNTNYLLAQLTLEQAGGTPLHELIRRYILTPLSLADTFTQRFETLPDTRDSTFVTGYQDWDGDGVPEDVSAINDGFGLGDGGLISTTQDITTFYRALLVDQTLLTPDSLSQMMNFTTGDEDVYGIGLDQWQTDLGPAIGHAGGVLGFVSIGVVLPDANVSIVVLCATTECVPEDVALMIAQTLNTMSSPQTTVMSTIVTEMQAQMDQEIAANPTIPGQMLTVVAPTSGIDFDLAAGIVDFESGTPLEPGASFRIASVTKTFTAAAVLRLVEMGQLDLDTSIEQYLSAESIALLQGDGYATDRITVRHLLLHTSAIPDFSSFNPAYITAVLADPQREWTRMEQLQFAIDTTDPLGEPGTQYSYSDTGYILLGELIERRTGQTLGAAVRDLLDYERLGLTNTYWEVQETAADSRPMAHQYFGDVDITTSLSPTIDLYGGGGLVSTTRDLTLFFRALLSGEVFEQPETLDTMLTIPDTNVGVDESMDAGMGIFRLSGGGLTCWNHGGFWGVFAMYCPDVDVAVARSIHQSNQQSVSSLSVINPVLIYILDSAS